MAETEFYDGLKTKFSDTIQKSAGSNDVINYIVQKVNEHVNTPFAKLVVKALSYGKPTREEFIKRVFDYVCHKVDYLRDPQGKEIIFTPKLLVNRGKGDCKKQTLFIATILKTAGIEPTLKTVSYGGQDWEHIYVTVKNADGTQTILDPVNDKKFNAEVKHKLNQEHNLNGTKSKIMPNELISMGDKNKESEFVTNYIGAPANRLLSYANNAGGTKFNLSKRIKLNRKDIDYFVGCMHDETIGRKKLKDVVKSATTAVKKAAADVKNVVKKVFHVAAAGEFAPERAAFLGVLKLGKALEKTPIKIHLAAKLAQLWNKDPDKIKTAWTNIGGDPSVLGRVIIDSAKVGVSGENYIGDFDEIDLKDRTQIGNSQYIGVVTIAAVSGAIASATPVIVIMKKLLHDAHIINDKEAAGIDSVVATAADLHNDDGTHTVDILNNDIIKKGRAAGDNGSSNSKNFPAGGTAADPNKSNAAKSSPSSEDPNANADNPPKKGCFLTTACVDYYGLPDNCYQLTTLRNFRDTYMTKEFPHLVNRYYQIAPFIVDSLKESPNKEIIFKKLFDKINLACKAIEQKNFEKAKRIYIDEVNRITTLFIFNKPKQTPCTK